MSFDYVRFTVKVLPPARQRGDERRQSEEPVQVLAIGAKPTETFEELWQKVQTRYNARSSQGHAQLGQLRDSSGADIFDEDTIGSLYDESPLGQAHTLYTRLNASDAGRPAVTASNTAEQGAKCRASEEGLDQERESVKRWKVQPQHSQTATGQQTDVVGFKLPKRKAQDDRHPRGGEFNSSATVIVEDSQPETTATAAGSAFTKLQQQRRLDASSPGSRSSPLVAAASRNAAVSRKVFPTPESHDRQRQGVHDDPSDQPMSDGRRVSSWFKRRISAKTASAPGTTATQEDPIEDIEPSPDALPAAPEPQSSTYPEGGDHGDKASRDEAGEIPKTDVNRRLHLKGEASGTLRTPSVQRSKSAQTEGSYAPSSMNTSERITNTERSVAHGWTKAEDDALLEGLTSGRGTKVKDVLKEHNINRSASAARSRYRLLIQNQKDRQLNTLNFPSSSLAMPQSEGDEEPSKAPEKSAVKRWGQSEVGTLRKAIGEGLDAREIQAKYLGDRSEEGIARKMHEVRKSVLKLEKEKDSFPNDTIRCYLWTDQHSLKLRRAYREGLNVVAAGFRYFKSMPKAVVEQKMKAYRQQMEDLNVEHAISQQSSPGAARAKQLALDRDEAVDDNKSPNDTHQQTYDATAGDEAPQIRDDVDVEILQEMESLEPPDGDDDDYDDAPMIPDSYDAVSAAVITSSPPLLRKHPQRSSPEVVIPPEEQRDTHQAHRNDATGQQAGQSQLRRSTSSRGQAQLNFQRDKGKGVARPAIDIHELDRQNNRQPSRVRAPAREQVAEQEIVEVSSDEDEDDGSVSDDHREMETPKAMPQLDGPSSAAKNKRWQPSSEHSASDSVNSDGNATISSGEPNRQLAFELQQSMSAAEQSTQSQAARIPRAKQSSESAFPPDNPTGYVHIPSPARVGLTSKAQKTQRQESEDEEDAFQTQDPRTTLSQQQKRKKASSRAIFKAMTGEKKAQASPDSSDDESPAFQTQGPSTTVSQKQLAKPQRKAEPARKATPILQDAVNRFDGLHGDVAPSESVSKGKSKADLVVPKPRRNVYDIPLSSQSAAGSQNQRSRGPLQPSSSEKRGPGQLPRILGPASRLAQRKKDAEAKIAAHKAEREARSTPEIQSAAAHSEAENDVQEFPRNDPSDGVKPLPNQLSAEAPEASSSHEEPGDAGPLSHKAEQIQHSTSTSVAVIADVSYDATSQTQTQVQVQPVVELPYPQILSRELGPQGKFEVGRPGHSFKVPQDCVYLRTEHAIFGAASRETTGTRNVMRLAEDMKLCDQQAIAMCCNDSDKLNELHKLERRRRRERRVEDGLPPSRGPVQQHWPPGMPKPIEWDVNVMPDSDDSMSSRGRNMEDIDEEMAEMEEARSAEMDDDGNPAYFERDRNFSEVEGRSDEDVDRIQRLLADAGKVDREAKGDASESESNDGEGDEELKNHDVTSEAAKRSDEERAASTTSSAVNEHVVAAERVGSSDACSSHQADVELDESTQVQSVEHIEEKDNSEEQGDENAAHNAAPVAIDLTARSVAEDEDQDGDDAELPTAPPPVSDNIDANTAPPPSDRELQDLVQSGDVEMGEDQGGAPAFAETRLPGLGSPALPAQEGAFNDSSLVATTSFSPINGRRSNKGTAEDHRRWNASPGVDAGLTDSMIPPWPSSGKVRSSREVSSTKTPPAVSDKESNMASKEEDVQAQASRNRKKRKREMTEDDYAEHKASRKAKRQERSKNNDAEKQSFATQSFAKHSTADLPPSNKQEANVAQLADNLTAAKVALPDPTSATAESSSKKKKNKKSKKNKRQQRVSGTSKTDALAQQPKQVRPDDRIAMPPPALPPRHAHVLQQSSLPSPDSEFSAKVSRSAKKRAAKRAKRDARRSSVSVSVNDAMSIVTSLSLPVASSPQTLAVMSAGVTAAPAENQSSLKGSLNGPAANSTQDKAKKPSSKLAASNKASHDSPVQGLPESPSAKDTRQTIERPNSRQTHSESKTSSHKKDTNMDKQPTQAAQQHASPPATRQVAKSIEKPEASSVDQNSKSSSRKKIEPKATPIPVLKSSQSSKGSAQLPKGNGKGSKPAVGASTGLRALVDFQAHIPDAPKARPQAQKGPVKPSLFEDDDEDSDSSSDSES